MDYVGQIIGPIPSWLVLGPVQDIDGVSLRRVEGDWSHLHEWDRPPQYVTADNLIANTPSAFDRSDAREPIQQVLPGRDIAELRGRYSGACVVLFNGQSLASHDLNKLKGLPIIGMNRTHAGNPKYDGPQPDYLCAVDPEWFAKPSFRKHPNVVNGGSLKAAKRATWAYRATPCNRMTPLSMDLGRDGYVPLRPGTTGFLALSLAVHLGFTTIYCLGLDLQGRHFDGSRGSLNFTMMRGQFRRVAKALKEAGIDVFCVGSPDSLAPFPKMSYEALVA